MMTDDERRIVGQALGVGVVRLLDERAVDPAYCASVVEISRDARAAFIREVEIARAALGLSLALLGESTDLRELATLSLKIADQMGRAEAAHRAAMAHAHSCLGIVASVSQHLQTLPAAEPPEVPRCH